ncbi:hypothetical protein [Janthinobacterium sp. 17J80-10]|uniref:hypothetical protein n=1 Tax=Janthinobacterium sp. 17J80-10 TaxID=2497863 RepID=UPI0010055FAA|nr:hypothetical protein [Janthinobacterium sp. 17J80-10]QAU34657.1 hypothetical protein EKL02_10945 [Janthinobacterium sp. 17J80-10]
MKLALGKLGVVALLTLGMTGAFARTVHDWQGGGTALERQMEWAQASQARRGNDDQQQYDRRGGGGGQDGRGGRDNDQFRNGPPQQGGYWQAPQDDGRRGGRMSPEERRELRRQIDEAGRNIYAPRGR